MSLTEHERQNKIFSGTIKHVELQCAHGVCLDFPFSLVADAVLLPITVPWSIVNWTRPAGDRPASGAIEQREGRE